MLLVPRCQQPRRGVEMLVRERLNLDAGHRRRTIALVSMPKTLTGAELQLDDGPARDAELFIVDGNNLAYRAFFALPEFTNMLFKLLSDYRPNVVFFNEAAHADIYALSLHDALPLIA